MVRKKISERKTNKEISRGTNNKIITMTASDNFVTNQNTINA
ncbi:hypothetical protein AC35_4912 [Escherichia coli 3-475-03_S3_C2]|jgi:hypothetical protein|uniref:Uncharacterized protein n=2 Tax=root TaxID=1 RepID=A0A653FQZ4_9CAUD|nr:hypothetical protein H3V32_gp55 [Escherichia phage 2H10]EII33979.1 hypothetical protein EC40967_5677 [Escherichia coli 4.0967]EMV23688.1 hypothetical protein ECBCE034MS14_1932 [Escherichia coli BCE034_MS-14]ENC47557.1 hypothetical protein ECP02999172_1764 [Escherichia coli P0299917.2]ENC56428.1 hypothetical protein ECP02999174_1808 [Escherichia coli P0299917.4]ENC62663.1 hypothetical protein ECP02999175_1486 [Escherichia coli P0299917.5]ENC72438.1 hypothetical protein ECP02999176_1878 [Esc